ncbi:hypothetical protein E2C01_088523 [Portunus trituberculatus]|uniref:Uncharacterized protein n=1 Tax=Portunus trituberculatus TaxID=210409 RepID=A0A5B7JJL8_PORTR|nr:hypothetical protein [Portunus trituberculatus]
MMSRPTLLPELGGGDMTKLCNHRRKLAIAFTHHLHNNAKKGKSPSHFALQRRVSGEGDVRRTGERQVWVILGRCSRKGCPLWESPDVCLRGSGQVIKS